MTITISITALGDLEIAASTEARHSLREARNDHGSYPDFPTEMFDLMERYSTNGSYTLFDAGQGNPFVGRTGAPCIAREIVSDEKGEKAVVGQLWWYPKYEIQSYIAELVETGCVVFQKA